MSIKRIKHIDAGIFKDYRPASGIPEFKTFNLIYGFNGSGKTTFSRVLRSLEDGNIKPDEAKFSLKMSDESEKEKGDKIENLLVFNDDFVEENLSEWREGKGTAEAIAITLLGADKREKAENLREIRDDLREKESQQPGLEKTERTAEKIFGNFKRDKARNIETSAGLGRGYNARSLAGDIDGYKKQDGNKLGENTLEIQVRAARDSASKDPIPEIVLNVSDIEEVINGVEMLLNRTGIEISLADVQDHSEMLPWIDEGHKYHKENEIDNCLLCGNRISDNRRIKLDALFNEQYQKSVDELKRAKCNLEESKALVERTKNVLPRIQDFDGRVSENSGEALNALTEMLDSCISNIDGYLDVILKKLQNLSKIPEHSLDFNNVAQELENKLTGINTQIGEHNGLVENAEQEKENAQDKVKKHYFYECFDDYKRYESELQDAKADLENQEQEIRNLRHSENEILGEMSHAGMAAQKINNLLNEYFGHNELTVSIETVEGVEGFILQRNNNPIESPPSAGEKSALALVYFLMKLEDRNSNKEKSIVVIDDPVSSMDGQALMYATNLIKSRTKDCEQVFYLTHNLQFMNEIKKWLKRKNEDKQIYVLEEKGSLDKRERKSELRRMPKLLLNHNSEYGYCFSLVSKFAGAESNMECAGLFNMPNLIRRVLETYFEFKLPHHTNLASRLESDFVTKKIATEDKGNTELQALKNLVDRDSHSDSQDALHRLQEFGEYHRAAKTLVKLICKTDKQHYKEMIKSLDDPQTEPAAP